MSSKPFSFLWGLKKKIPHDCPITLVIHYLYSTRLEKREARARVRDTDFLKGCWESSLTKILCTQRHSTGVYCQNVYCKMES